MPPVAKRLPRPYWTTIDKNLVRLYQGNAVDVLRQLPAGSVHCITTSPPYWGLRDYGTDQQIGSEPSPDCNTHGQAQCGRCFICSMVGVFREVRRVLRDDGVLWLNLGDTYGRRNDVARMYGKETQGAGLEARKGLEAGNLIGIPWRVALALQADGWILRSDIPWVKRASVPESVTNRPCKALEYVFMFVKKMGYYFDMDAVKKESKDPGRVVVLRDKSLSKGQANAIGKPFSGNALKDAVIIPAMRNFRNADLWFESLDESHGVVVVEDEMVGLDVTHHGYAGAHYACYPPRLIEPLIQCSTAPKCCPNCGKCWQRVVEKTATVRSEERGDRDRSMRRNRNGIGGTLDGQPGKVSTLGWRPVCKCYGATSQDPRDYKDLKSVPAVVLDPFVGSGTTCEVAALNGRASIGIELSEKYLKHDTVPRITKALRRKPSLWDQIPE